MFTLNCKGRLLTIERPIVMGILNITDDSFYGGSRYQSDRNLLKAAEQMILDGATILDIGGQSTRPGSELVDADTECARAVAAVEMIAKAFPEIIISIDTFYAKVAKEAVAAGASIINDISAGEMDETFLDMVAALNVPYILMHMQGTPQTMQQKPSYEHITAEVFDFFVQKLQQLRSRGVKDIIIDPGFGFGKNNAHNFALLKDISLFKLLQCPILLGVSRKGMIYRTLEIDANNALNGTTVLNTFGLCNGASILRVHDVKEAMEAIKLIALVTTVGND